MYNAKRENVVFIIGALLLLILISINSPGNKNLLKAKFIFVKGYIYIGEVFKNISDYVSDTLKSYRVHRETYLENIRLKRELSKLISENFLLQKKLEELSKAEKINSNVIPSKIVFWDIRNPYNFIYVRLLSSEDSLEGYVLDNKGNLVGNVTASVKENIYSVILITSNDSSVSVKIKGKNSFGIMFGKGVKYCEVKYLKTTDFIERGDVVYTTGYDGLYDSEIPVGKVIEVKDMNYYKSAIVEPFFINTMFSGNDYVEIIKKKKIIE